MKKWWHNIKLQVKLAFMAYYLIRAGMKENVAKDLAKAIYKKNKK